MMVIGVPDIVKWLAAILASLVSLLTLYNAARLRSGILAASMAASGIGMLLLAFGFLLLAAPAWADQETINMVYGVVLMMGFILLGFGSFKIYQMSKIK